MVKNVFRMLSHGVNITNHLLPNILNVSKQKLFNVTLLLDWLIRIGSICDIKELRYTMLFDNLLDIVNEKIKIKNLNLLYRIQNRIELLANSFASVVTVLVCDRFYLWSFLPAPTISVWYIILKELMCI